MYLMMTAALTMLKETPKLSAKEGYFSQADVSASVKWVFQSKILLVLLILGLCMLLAGVLLRMLSLHWELPKAIDTSSLDICFGTLILFVCSVIFAGIDRLPGIFSSLANTLSDTADVAEALQGEPGALFAKASDITFLSFLVFLFQEAGRRWHAYKYGHIKKKRETLIQAFCSLLALFPYSLAKRFFPGPIAAVSAILFYSALIMASFYLTGILLQLILKCISFFAKGAASIFISSMQKVLSIVQSAVSKIRKYILDTLLGKALISAMESTIVIIAFAVIMKRSGILQDMLTGFTLVTACITFILLAGVLLCLWRIVKIFTK